MIVRRLSGKGGMETVIRSLADAALEQGDAQVHVWAMGDPLDKDWLGGLPHHVLRIDQGTGKRFQLKTKLPLYTWAIRSLMKKDPVDVVLATDPVFVAAAVKARRDGHPKVLSWVHFSLDALANVEYLRSADGHLAISSGIRNQIQALGPRSAPSLVHNPVPESPPYTKSDPRPGHLAFIGRLNNRQKRLDVLFQALALTSHPDWHLTIVGDGPDRTMLQELSETLDIDKKLTWSLWQPRPWHDLNPAYLCLSSDFEGFPMALLEALARGVPVLATDCPTGPRDIVIPGKNGWLSPVGDVKTFAMHLDRALSQVPLAWDSDAIREDALARFGADQVFKRVQHAIKEAPG